MRSTKHKIGKRLGLLLTILLPLWVNAQNIGVNGTVKDSFGEAVIGASVFETGTTNGTITDIDGNFTLNVPADGSITVSFIGYRSATVNVSGRSNINITLEEDTEVLDEVVVVGYGVQKKKLVTGATVQVKGEDLQKLNTVSPLSALQSQSPGINIVQSSGMPGEGFKVTIRGLGTVGSSEPLYVIDGVAGGDLNLLNPSDIESIDVLKDAASAAIYGARAANGVVLVTTRQGREGKMTFSYDGYYGVQNIAKMPKLLNAKQYMDVMDKISVNDGGQPYDWASLIPVQYPLIMNGTWNGTNWMKEAENKNAPMQNHAFNLNGGNEQSKFSLGFSYTSQEGIIGKPVEPHYERYTARINSDHVLLKGDNFDIIKIGQTLNYAFTERSGIGIGNIYWNDTHNFLTAVPLLPLYDKNGEYYDYYDKQEDKWNWEGNAANPIAAMVHERGQNLTKYHRLRANVYAEIQPIKDLRFRSSFGYRMNASSYRSYQSAYRLSNNAQRVNDNVNQNQSVGNHWTWENTLAYSLKVSDHTIDAVLGQSVEKWGLGEGVGATNINSLFPGKFDYAYIDNTQGITPGQTTVSGAPWSDGALASFFGRANYNYMEKYMASVTVRADGSSNFARGNRWGYFPSVSAGWVLTNEPFMESVRSWMDFLKLRVSWGQNGNSSIENFQYLSTIAFDTGNSYVFGTDETMRSTGAYANILPNPDVSWETSEQWDFGIDARFFRSRLGLAFDYYHKKTKDWLVQAPVLASYGTGAPYINGGDIVNKGVELALSWQDYINSDFNYGVNLNLAYNHNEVTRIANTEGIIHGPENVLTFGVKEMYRAQVGYPIGYFYGFKTKGIFQNQQQIDQTQAKLPGAQPGDVIFVDYNGDGEITDDDRTMIGNPHPDITLGFSLNMGYKGFDFSLSATGAFGHQIMKSYRQFVGEPKQNFTTEVFDYWDGEGTSNKLPRLTDGGHSNWSYISEVHMQDADYVKIQNVTLGYDFKKLFPKMPLSQARLYIAANNLYTFTGYTGMDPEIGYGNDHNWASGIDLGFYPSARTYMVGVNIKY